MTPHQITQQILEEIPVELREKKAALASLAFLQPKVAKVLGRERCRQFFNLLVRTAGEDKPAVWLLDRFISTVTKCVRSEETRCQKFLFDRADDFFRALVKDGPIIADVGLTPIGVLNELFNRLRGLAPPPLRVNRAVRIRKRLRHADATPAAQRYMYGPLLELADRYVIPGELTACMLRATRALDRAIEGDKTSHLFVHPQEFIAALVEIPDIRKRVYAVYTDLAHAYARPASLPVIFRSEPDMRQELIRQNADGTFKARLYPLLLEHADQHMSALDAALAIATVIDVFTGTDPLPFRLQMYEYAYDSLVYALIADVEHARFTGLVIKMIRST